MTDHAYIPVVQEYRGSSRLYSTGGKKRKDKDGFTHTELLRWGRLLVCAVVFLALVVTKVNMPERFQELRGLFAAQMENSVDYRAVFSAVGRAVSGESSVQEAANNVYVEVFRPASVQAVETGVTVPLLDLSRQEPSEVLLAFSQQWAEGSAWLRQEQDLGVRQMVTAVTASEFPSGTASSESSQNMTPSGSGTADTAPGSNNGAEELPEGVYMEQKVLGFSYTTPVTGWLSSPFGYREHPVDGEEKFHRGLDIAAPEGSDIVSFADGTVKAAGESSALGKYIMVSHANGITSLYAHCSKWSVSSGAVVKKGEKIAEVGHTGLATGSHLHFCLLDGETYLNPIYYVTLEEK